MGILLFIVVIVVLILVHEFGHFIVAKWVGMRVDEFGIGFPPRALTITKKGDTVYTLNWLPFGGFVKIYGENSDAVDEDSKGRAFTDKNRFAQALVLVAGVAMNFLFAYILITVALFSGTPRALSPEEIPLAEDASLAISGVLQGSPAERAGLMPGDIIRTVEDEDMVFSSTDSEKFTEFVSEGNGQNVITLTVVHTDGSEETLSVRPEKGVIAGEPSRSAIGVSVSTIGTVPVSFFSAIKDGAILTWGATVLTAQGLAHFFAGVFTLSADLSQVSGPVGIAGAVGDAGSAGIGTLLALAAIISINLGIINLIPIPALDGGRLLFVIIEAIIRRPIKPSIAQTVNGIGFLLLILLMVVVTFNDVFRLVG